MVDERAVEEPAVDRTTGSGPVRRHVWRVLPSEAAVQRWVRRLLSAAAGSLAVGLPDLARVAGEGRGSEQVPTGALAVGYSLLTAALALPVLYWAVVLSTAAGTLAGRRVGLRERVRAAWRVLRQDHPKRGPSAPSDERLRL